MLCLAMHRNRELRSQNLIKIRQLTLAGMASCVQGLLTFIGRDHLNAAAAQALDQALH